MISTQSPSDLFLSECNETQELDRADKELFVQHVPGGASKIAVADQLSEILPLLVSPDGRYAVLETYAADIPPYWGAYRTHFCTRTSSNRRDRASVPM